MLRRALQGLLVAIVIGGAAAADKNRRAGYMGHSNDVAQFDTKRKCEKCIDAEQNLIGVISEHDEATDKLMTATKNLNAALEVEGQKLATLVTKNNTRGGAKDDVGKLLTLMEGALENDKPGYIVEKTPEPLKSLAEAWQAAQGFASEALSEYNDAVTHTGQMNKTESAKNEAVNELQGPLKAAKAKARSDCLELRRKNVDEPPNWIGCYKHHDQQANVKFRIWHENRGKGGTTYEECENAARNAGSKIFALEWPQGYDNNKFKNEASCAFGDGDYTAEGEVELGECTAEKDGKGRPLGSAYRMAVYSVESPIDVPKPKKVNPWLGCWSHTSQKAVTFHIYHSGVGKNRRGATYEDCEEAACADGADFFVLEYPNGYSQANVASCGYGKGEGYKKDGPADDNDCAKERDAHGRRLGNGYRMATYRPKCSGE